jgi:hypothetical protein
MKLIFATYIPYRAAERTAYGEKIDVAPILLLGTLITPAAMIWAIRKARKEKRAKWGKKKR